MRIGRADFEIGNVGHVYQAVLDAVPEEEAVGEEELRNAYDRVTGEEKPSFERVLENLEPFLTHRSIGTQTYYMRRRWLSSTDVAKALSVSRRTVQAWYQQGLLLGRRVGGRLQFAAEAVQDRISGKRSTSATTVKDPVLDELWDNEVDARYERL